MIRGGKEKTRKRQLMKAQKKGKKKHWTTTVNNDKKKQPSISCNEIKSINCCVNLSRSESAFDNEKKKKRKEE